MHAFEHACRTTQGARHYQEDSAAFLVIAEDEAEGGDAPPRLRRMLAVLADGMGGHAAGDVASDLLCTTFISAFGAAAAEGATIADQLLGSLEQANSAIAERVAEEPATSGMGSTLIGALLGPDGLAWISVGDSPLYLWRGGEIAQLNQDHSLAPELDKLAAAGHMTVAEARADPRRHMLRSAVTGEEITLIDMPALMTPLFAGDYVLLASDGLQSLEDAELARIVSAYQADGPDAVAEALIRGVENLRVPHQDNATVIAVRVVA